jgi:hypothetical protein
VKLIIPNFKTKSFLSEEPNLVLCKMCLERLNKFCSASKISSDQDRLLRDKMFERQKRNENARKVIPRDKTDHRDFLEIEKETKNETRKEIGIWQSDMCYY